MYRQRVMQTIDKFLFSYELFEKLEEPHRFYHYTRHIAELLFLMDEIKEKPEFDGIDFDIIELMILFHDIVYDIPSSGGGANEIASAEYARNILAGSFYSTEVVNHVTNGILATISHTDTNIEMTPEIKLFLDMDLSILISEPNRYEYFEAQIRQEYEYVPWEQYVKGRSHILSKFIKAAEENTLYHYPYFQKWNMRAIANMTRAIETMNIPSQDIGLSL